jgi:hypothetical protein
MSLPYRIADISNKHIDVIQCADNDCIGLHEEFLCWLNNVIVEIRNGLGEEILNRLKDCHVNLHLEVVEEISLRNVTKKIQRLKLRDLRYLRKDLVFERLGEARQ